jgi:hypothetical protein
MNMSKIIIVLLVLVAIGSAILVANRSSDEGFLGMGHSAKCIRDPVKETTCGMISTNPEYQSALCPRFSSSGYGAYITHSPPQLENLAVDPAQQDDEELKKYTTYDRFIFSNAKSRQYGQGDWIRGDLPIAPVPPNSDPASNVWFRPAARPATDLNQGALNVLGGYDNESSKALQTLVGESQCNMTAFGGAPVVEKIVALSPGVSDVQVQ